VTVSNDLRERVVEMLTTLSTAYASPSGIFGYTEAEKPEMIYTTDIPQHVLPHFLMNVCTFDYATSATPLWKGAQKAFEDPSTRFIFTPSQVKSRGVVALRKAMEKATFYGRYPEQNANNLYRVHCTVVDKYNGNILNLLKLYRNNAHALWEARLKVGEMPVLTGPKVWPFFLRLLCDVAHIPLIGLREVPIPVDVHILRSTDRLIIGTNRAPDQKRAKEVRALWSELLDGTPFYPLLIDRELWTLSRYGCSGTDNKKTCAKKAKCPVSAWCVFSEGVYSSGNKPAGSPSA